MCLRLGGELKSQSQLLGLSYQISTHVAMYAYKPHKISYFVIYLNYDHEKLLLRDSENDLVQCDNGRMD